MELLDHERYDYQYTHSGVMKATRARLAPRYL
jgi:hypothetical protein